MTLIICVLDDQELDNCIQNIIIEYSLEGEAINKLMVFGVPMMVILRCVLT